MRKTFFFVSVTNKVSFSLDKFLALPLSLLEHQDIIRHVTDSSDAAGQYEINGRNKINHASFVSCRVRHVHKAGTELQKLGDLALAEPLSRRLPPSRGRR